MNAARSPTGEPHPGEILNVDEVHGKSWSDQASDVPQTIGWVRVGGSWIAVVRIEATGTEGHLRITKFGANGARLETTVQGPPRPLQEDSPPAVPTRPREPPR